MVKAGTVEVGPTSSERRGVVMFLIIQSQNIKKSDSKSILDVKKRGVSQDQSSTQLAALDRIFRRLDTSTFYFGSVIHNDGLFVSGHL